MAVPRLSGRRLASGHRIGQWHQNAKLADREVHVLRFLHTRARALGIPAAGPRACGGYGWLARVFKCGVSTARDIVTYRTRCDA